ncbi:putative structural protein [Pseudomonas phage psageK4]|uniref:Structural protein n=1 Tax=Pseudomonas phage psageK4 TaxID=2859563 RepID=A0ABX8SMA3_9CAUD|nr:putative structural protein [Pseudomonas phage psageK4]QXV71730.1 putative structural protein [Pseudomonas phage psageK4]
MASLLNYSPNDVTITVAGLYSVTGYAEGTFVRITKDTQQISTTRAMDGTMSRVKSPDTGWKVEITLAQSSSGNDIFSTLWNVDKVTGMGKFPLFIKDGSGSTMFMAATAWIEEIPDIIFSNQMETRTWRFGATDVIINVGGNGDGDLSSILGLSASVLPVLQNFKIT